jgi:hypothetical protein
MGLLRWQRMWTLLVACCTVWLQTARRGLAICICRRCETVACGNTATVSDGALDFAVKLPLAWTFWPTLVKVLAKVYRVHWS